MCQQETSQQENKCCSTMPYLERAKQLMEKHAQLVEEVSQETSLYRLAEETECCSGFATETPAASKEQVIPDMLYEALAQKPPTPEAQSAGGLLGRLSRYLKNKQLTYIPGMQSPHRLRHGQGSGGTQRQTDSQCQCAMYKGKSLG